MIVYFSLYKIIIKSSVAVLFYIIKEKIYTIENGGKIATEIVTIVCLIKPFACIKRHSFIYSSIVCAKYVLT